MIGMEIVQRLRSWTEIRKVSFAYIRGVEIDVTNSLAHVDGIVMRQVDYEFLDRQWGSRVVFHIKRT